MLRRTTLGRSFNVRRRLWLQPLENRLAPAIFTVTNTLDSGAGSLRQAVLDANANTGADTIDFNPASFQTIMVTGGVLSISDPVTITAGPSSLIVLDANLKNRIFDTTAAPDGSQIVFENLKLFRGHDTSAVGGGGILVGGEAVTLTGCHVDNCVSTGNFGGGIHVSQPMGKLTLNDCLVFGNSADGLGGGVAISGGATAVIQRCSFSKNIATEHGGGLWFAGSNLSIIESTFSSNTASRGGAIRIVGQAAGDVLSITNCTISGNTASLHGGGISFNSSAALATIRNTTITANINTGSESGSAGGLATIGNITSLTLESSIVAGNSNTANVSAPDVDFANATNVAGNNNLIGVADVSNLTLTGVSNLTGTSAKPLDAKLGPLANNGGPTNTHLPLVGSPVIDAGNNSASLTNDQRGGVHARVSGATVDIGAVEVQKWIVTSTADNGPGSLREMVQNANLSPVVDTITFSPTVFSVAQTISLSTGELSVTDHVTITGPAAQLTIDAGKSSRMFNIESIFATTVLEVQFEQMKFVNGQSAGEGGAIFGKNVNLDLSNCNFSNNTGGSGGAVFFTTNQTAKFTITNGEFTGNMAGLGGAIRVTESTPSASAESVVSNCIFSGNNAQIGGAFNLLNGSLTVMGSTISGNTALGNSGSNGGGIFIEAFGGGSNFLGVFNSTISGNTASRDGGGVFFKSYGTIQVRNSTITANSATGGSSCGGGIAKPSDVGSVILDSTIVAGNTAFFAPDLLLGGAETVTGDHNLIGVADQGVFAFGGSNNRLGALAAPLNAKLGPLANNGGTTQTHIPLAGSPAINAGNNVALLTNDQRGTGFPRSFGGGIDIGATESKFFVVTSKLDSGNGSLRQAILDANSVIGSSTVSFDPLVFGSATTITLTSGEILIEDLTTIDGPGSQLLTINLDSPITKNRAFVIDLKSAKLPIHIEGVTIANGNSTTDGGAIFNEDALLTLTDCAFIHNGAIGNGGAVFVDNSFASLEVYDCTFSDNIAGATGGAVAFLSGNELTIKDTTIAENSAANGGGVAFNGTVGLGGFSIINSTLSGNTAQTDGGAVFLSSFAGEIVVHNSTITQNQSSSKGGGIALQTGSGTITIFSTIVSGNTSLNGKDISSHQTVNVNFSAIGISTGFILSGANNIPFNTNLLLGPLANNGGSTLTHLPAPTSPVVNAGGNFLGLTTDQRGAGFARLFGGGFDIGAIESTGYVVVNTDDSGLGSLREMLTLTNAAAGANTITFAAHKFDTAKTIALASGELSISDAVTITGPANGVTIDAGQKSRVINATAVDVTKPVVLQNLVLTNGKLTTPSQNGGAILTTSPDLTLIQCTISNSSAESGLGGAVFVNQGKLTIQDSIFVNNSSVSGGALLISSAIATISGSTLNNNKALSGGAIIVQDGGSLTIANSTISGNQAGVRGGGISFNTANFQIAVVLDSTTVSGNTAGKIGGGIDIVNLNGTLLIRNSTITGNVATTTSGGGIYKLGNTGTVTLESTIVAGNSAPSAADLSCKTATSIAGDNNLIGIADVGNFKLTGTKNLVGQQSAPLDALLGPLANNGGPTQTHALLDCSPALNAGNNTAGLSFDQRGSGSPRVTFGIADIGAFEAQTFNGVFWDGGGGNDLWSNPLNWNTDKVPQTGDDVLIFGATKVTFASGTAVVDCVYSSVPFNLTNGTLEVNGTGAFQAPVSQSGGFFTGSGAVTLYSGGSFSNGQLAGAGKWLVPAGATWTISTAGTFPQINGRNIDIAGQAIWVGTNSISSIPNISALTVLSGGVFDVQGDGNWNTPTSINIAAGGLLKRSVSAGTATFNTPFNNAGTVDVLTGTLTLAGGGTNTGTFNLTGGINFASGSNPGPTELQGSAKITGAGPITVSGNTVTIQSGAALSGLGVLDLSGGTLNVNADLNQVAAVHLSGGTLAGNGNVTLGAGGTFTNGALTGNGKWIVAAGQTWTLTNIVIINNRVIEIAGTAKWVGLNSVGGSGGSVTVLSGGLFDFQTDTSWNTNSAPITIDAGGTLRRSVGTSSVQVNGSPVINNGTIEVLTGTLTFHSGGTHTGTFNLTGGINLAGGTTVFQSPAKITGAGAFTVSGSNVTFDPGTSLSGLGVINLPAGTLNLNTDLIQIAPLNMSGGGVFGSGNVTLSGGGSVTQGQLGGSGKWFVPAGQNWTISGPLILVGRNIEVAGTTTWQGDHAISGSSGSLTVKSGGVFDARLDVNWNTNAPILVDAGGLFQRTVGTSTLTINGALFTNNGTVEALSGTLVFHNGLTNFSGTTLTGGKFDVSATLQFSNANIVTNQAHFILNGPAAKVQPAFVNTNALAVFANNGAFGALSIINGHALTVPNTFTNSGALNIGIGSTLATAAGDYVQTAGTTTVAGTLDPFGVFQLQGGTLNSTGSILSDIVNTGGTIEPGNSPGSLTINGNYSQSGTGKLNIELNGLTPGTLHDQLAVNGTVNLGGVLQVSVGYDAKVGDSFVILANDSNDTIGNEFSGLPDGSKFTIGKYEMEIDYQGGTGNDVVLTVTKVITAQPPTAKIQVNDGSMQRSMVTSFKVSFSEAVTFPSGIADAFQLVRTGPGTPVGAVTLALNQIGNDVLITFNDPVFAAGNAKSLIDGNYTLTLIASKIQGAGGALDGNGDGTGGDDQSVATHRLFGDADGNRTVTATDFNAFRLAYGSTGPSIFDFNGDNLVSASDFNEFRTRFGSTLVP